MILIAAAGGAFLFRHELKTLYSLKKVDDNVLYTMKYDGDYGFDEFLETGASSDRELVEFVTKRLLKGIPWSFPFPTWAVPPSAHRQRMGTAYSAGILT